eukprot:c4512_g1_i1.p1 GENE.c4512_g1_i1~~c4512_g1_i1.p1  ORF type:complete len:202 (+),score=38.90 c4512_g1_i1:125-730(+)
MPKAKKAKKFAAVKKMISPNDARLKTSEKSDKKSKKKDDDQSLVHHAQAASSAMFFSFNTSLGPPYYIILDTNVFSICIQNKLDIVEGLRDALLAQCFPLISDCVMAELEKLGTKYRLALRIARQIREKFEESRLPCDHLGTYADDCIVQRVTAHKCYIVATQDRDLRRRLRRIPGVPIMYVSSHKFAVERMPDAFGSFGF